MDLIWKLVIAVGAMTALVGASYGITWAADAGVGSGIAQDGIVCAALPGGANSRITVITGFPAPSISVDVREIDNAVCGIIRSEQDTVSVQHHLRSDRTTFVDREGTCLWDTADSACQA